MGPSQKPSGPPSSWIHWQAKSASSELSVPHALPRHSHSGLPLLSASHLPPDTCCAARYLLRQAKWERCGEFLLKPDHSLGVLVRSVPSTLPLESRLMLCLSPSLPLAASTSRCLYHSRSLPLITSHCLYHSLSILIVVATSRRVYSPPSLPLTVCTSHAL